MLFVKFLLHGINVVYWNRKLEFRFREIRSEIVLKRRKIEVDELYLPFFVPLLEDKYANTHIGTDRDRMRLIDF